LEKKLECERLLYKGANCDDKLGYLQSIKAADN